MPQFTTPHGWAPTTQMLTLGGLHLVDIALIYFEVAAFAKHVLSTRPRAMHITTIISGVLMTGIGATILIEKAIELI
ncbi:MAG: hypothetical protein QM571_05705 [Micrococcaceae bacterium]